MKTFLNVVLVADAVLLVTLILIQNRGAGLSGAFGGDSAINYQRRGGEKVLHYLTIVLAIIFVGAAFATLFVK